jgi:hypothetical protein
MQGLAETSWGLVRRRRRDSTCGDASVIDSARKVIAKSCLEASIMGSLISNAYYRSRSGARENCLPRFQRTHCQSAADSSTSSTCRRHLVFAFYYLHSTSLPLPLALVLVLPRLPILNVPRLRLVLQLRFLSSTHHRGLRGVLPFVLRNSQ